MYEEAAGILHELAWNMELYDMRGNRRKALELKKKLWRLRAVFQLRLFRKRYVQEFSMAYGLRKKLFHKMKIIIT